jgi:hypothetical protein
MNNPSEILDQLVNATFLYPLVIVLFVGSAEFGASVGRRARGRADRAEDLGTLTVSSLGLLALLLAFALSHALSRYEDRRDLVLEEANAIESTADLAAMLPSQAQAPILNLLHDYAVVRIGLGVPYDPAKFARDVAKSVDLLHQLWRQAAAVSEPQSLPANRFINSLDEMTKLQERRLQSLRYHVPNEALLILVAVALVAIWFTGYQAGLTETKLRLHNLAMAGTLGVVIVLVVDLDQPARGLIQVPVTALVGVAKQIQP